MILTLSAMRAYAIVTGDDPEQQPFDFDHNNNYDDCKAKEAEAACMIRLSCSPEIRCIVKGKRNPHEMRNTLKTSLDTAGCYIGRQDIVHQFRACRPRVDEPLDASITKLSNYRTQLDHTDDAITDRDFRTQIFTSLPSLYATILMVLNSVTNGSGYGPEKRFGSVPEPSKNPTRCLLVVQTQPCIPLPTGFAAFG